MAEDDASSQAARRLTAIAPRRVWALVIVGHLTLLAYLLLMRSFTVGMGDGLTELARGIAAWDSVHYLSVARSGYREFNLAVLFPAYPAVTALVALLLRDVYVSAYVVSFVTHVLGAVLLYRLTRLDQSATVSWRTVFFSLVFPTAFAAVAPYSESLFLASAIGAFYFFRQGRYAYAGGLAFLASATRLPGFALMPALLAELLVNRRGRRAPKAALAATLAPCLGVIAFLAVNAVFYGDPLYFMAVQRFHFARQIAWPHVGAIGAWNTLVSRAAPECLTVGFSELLGGALAWVVTIYAALKLRPGYAVYCGLSAGLFTFQAFWLCNLRYAYVLFPLYILMARASRRHWVYYALTGVSLVGLALLAMQFARGHWAA
jgi:hypothetical protein